MAAGGWHHHQGLCRSWSDITINNGCRRMPFHASKKRTMRTTIRPTTSGR
jgi:hypothetical protein